MQKMIAALICCVLSTTLFAGIASAHVTVQPKETTQGKYEVFTVRVPTEKDIATVKVEVKIPAEVTISRFEPKPNWEYEMMKDSTGKITSIVWTATNDGLSSTEFGEFKMSGRVADDAAAIAWKAYQTYQDGSIVEWVGAEGSDNPASVTKVKASSASTDSHGNTDSAAEQTGSSTSNISLYFSIAAFVVSVMALILSLRKKAH